MGWIYAEWKTGSYQLTYALKSTFNSSKCVSWPMSKEVLKIRDFEFEVLRAGERGTHLRYDNGDNETAPG